MKKWILCSCMLMSFIVSQSALADHRFARHGFNDFGNSRHYSRNFNRGFNRSRVNAYHYGNGWRGGNFVNISYGNRWGNRWGNRGWNNGWNNNGWNNRGWGNRGWGRQNGSNFVGGLVLGSLLSTPRVIETQRERVVYRSAPVHQTQEVVYTNRSVQPTSAPRRRLLRDLSGNCFEIVQSPSGDEIRSQISSAACNF